MKRIVAGLLLLSAIIVLLPMEAQAISLVPCGTRLDKGTPNERCKLQHLVILIVRMINYLISVAAFVAMYHIVLGGWNLVTALGSSEKIQSGKDTITRAVIGFAIVALAFMFVNLLVNGIFGQEGTDREWWSVRCIFLDARECPLGAGVPKT